MAGYSAAEVARQGIIAEQNGIIAAAYDALKLCDETYWATQKNPTVLQETNAMNAVRAAVDLIENWRQKREPDSGAG